MRRLRRVTACVAMAASAVALAAPATTFASATPPQNPFRAANPFSNLHNDTWMTNVHTTIAGPTAAARTASGTYLPSVGGSLLFDARDQIVSVCPGAVGPEAPIISPTTLKVIATNKLAGATAQWAWAALSLRPGRTAFTVPTGTGTLYNNNYASISLGPAGNAHLSTIGGLTELRRR